MPRIAHRKITVQGIVQGVGFRPYVCGLTSRFGLRGTARNSAADAVIEVEGHEASLQAFTDSMVAEALPLSMIEHLQIESGPIQGYCEFTIRPSEPGSEKAVSIAPDVAPCPSCLDELRDSHERRHHYPLLNCTDCGPRFTIVTDIPYDRANTTMAAFAMCPACRAVFPPKPLLGRA